VARRVEQVEGEAPGARSSSPPRRPRCRARARPRSNPSAPADATSQSAQGVAYSPRYCRVIAHGDPISGDVAWE